jgi:transcription initiation factor TFIIIB Brf1 subunit/transcription initiation factor TFIIB
MSDLETLLKLNEEYTEMVNIDDEQVCTHEHTVIEKSVTVCADCGEELLGSEVKCSIDQVYSSMNERKNSSKNIYKDIEKFNFNESIVSNANALYNRVTAGKTKRGDRRKAIILACVFFSHKMANINVTYDKLLQMFDIKRKIGNDGLTHVTLNVPKDISKNFSTEPQCLIMLDEIMDKFSVPAEQRVQVKDIYHRIFKKSSSSYLNRCRVHSLASSILYYWIVHYSNITMSVTAYSEIVKLKELTINKICKEIELTLK